MVLILFYKRGVSDRGIMNKGNKQDAGLFFLSSLWTFYILLMPNSILHLTGSFPYQPSSPNRCRPVLFLRGCAVLPMS
jgi:hypothetical protein